MSKDFFIDKTKVKQQSGIDNRTSTKVAKATIRLGQALVSCMDDFLKQLDDEDLTRYHNLIVWNAFISIFGVYIKYFSYCPEDKERLISQVYESIKVYCSDRP